VLDIVWEAFWIPHVPDYRTNAKSFLACYWSQMECETFLQQKCLAYHGFDIHKWTLYDISFLGASLAAMEYNLYIVLSLRWHYIFILHEELIIVLYDGTHLYILVPGRSHGLGQTQTCHLDIPVDRQFYPHSENIHIYSREKSYLYHTANSLLCDKSLKTKQNINQHWFINSSLYMY